MIDELESRKGEVVRMRKHLHGLPKKKSGFEDSMLFFIQG
jgi:hypothetical protein